MAVWKPCGPKKDREHGQLLFSLVNLSDFPLSGFRLVYTSLTRNTDRSAITNAVFVRRDANYHEFAPPDGLVLAPGEAWDFAVGGLNRAPNHITDGVSTAYLILADGSVHDLDSGDLMPADAPAESAGTLMPAGELTEPVAIIPWPNVLTLDAFGVAPVALAPAADALVDERMALAEVAALAQRLFPNDHTGFALTPMPGARTLRFSRDTALAEAGYALEFGPDSVTLSYAARTGLTYGLITLAQMLEGRA